jgi:hypothetical protein
MIDSMMNDDALSLSMFWAGALMVFTPVIAAGAVIAVVWRQRLKERGGHGDAGRGSPP